MDKSSVLKAFNNHFFEFIEDIVTLFPNDENIKHSKNTLELFRKANPTSIVKAWHHFLYLPYHVEIDAGNIDFFINKDYAADLTYMADNAGKIMSVIDNLREPIRNMADGNKEKSIKYLQNLNKLTKMYIYMFL